MPDLSFIGDGTELRRLVNRLDCAALSGAACVGLPASEYHPEVGSPSDDALVRCTACPAQLACLALALRTETTDERHGWFGGLSPVERSTVAASICSPPEPRRRADEAADLHNLGLSLDAIAARLGCSCRTVRRYLSAVA